MSPFPPRARRWATIESVHQPYFLWSKQHAAEQNLEQREAVVSLTFLCSSAQPRSSENEAWGLSPRSTTVACHKQSAVGKVIAECSNNALQTTNLSKHSPVLALHGCGMLLPLALAPLGAVLAVACIERWRQEGFRRRAQFTGRRENARVFLAGGRGHALHTFWSKQHFKNQCPSGFTIYWPIAL